MRTLRTGTAALLMFSLAASASAGDLQQSIANAVAQQARQEEKALPKNYSKPLVWGGAALFVTGMTVGLFAFINNENGEFAEFGEANAVNKQLGTIGLATAFVGGTMMFLGTHRRGAAASRAPSIAVGAGQVKVSKHVSW
jgi:Na+/proline symporter